MLDEVKVEWAWEEEGITILAVLEARECLETRVVEGCEGLADSTDGGLVECRSHHEGLIDGFKCNDRTNKFDGQEIDCMCVYCCFLSSTNNPSISIHDHNTRRMSVMIDEVRRKKTKSRGDWHLLLRPLTQEVLWFHRTVFVLSYQGRKRRGGYVSRRSASARSKQCLGVWLCLADVWVGRN